VLPADRLGWHRRRSGNEGQVRFEVWGDGNRLAQAEATGSGGAVALNANVSGVDVLELRLDPGETRELRPRGLAEPADHLCGTPPPAGKSKLGDRPWTAMTNGWGPLERNRSNGEQAAGDGSR